MGAGIVVSAIGQVDDTAIVSNNLFDLSYLLELTNTLYGTKNCVEICAEETKLQVYAPDESYDVSFDYAHNPIKINGLQIKFSSTAEHVGIVRSIEGNRPTIFAGFTGHRRALAAVMHIGGKS